MFICPIYTTFTPHVFLTWCVSSYLCYYFLSGLVEVHRWNVYLHTSFLSWEMWTMQIPVHSLWARLHRIFIYTCVVAFGGRITQELHVYHCGALWERITHRSMWFPVHSVLLWVIEGFWTAASAMHCTVVHKHAVFWGGCCENQLNKLPICLQEGTSGDNDEAF